MTSTTGAKRGPYAPTKKRRDEIGAVVVALVDEVGPEEITTSLVASRCGIPEPTVMYHFPTKDHLLVAALERIDEMGLAEAHVDEASTFDLDQLRSQGASLQTNERRLRLYQMMQGLSSSPDHAASAYFRHRYARQRAIFAELIVHSQKAGTAHPGLDPQVVAVQLIGLWDGLTSQWVHDRSFDIGEHLVDGFRRLTGANWMDAVAHLREPNAGL